MLRFIQIREQEIRLWNILHASTLKEISKTGKIMYGDETLAQNMMLENKIVNLVKELAFAEKHRLLLSKKLSELK